TLAAGATADGGASFELDASDDVRFYFAVTGPASATPIPIRITYAGGAISSGPVADGLAQIGVDRLSPSASLVSPSFGVSTVFPPATDSFGDTVPADADVDAVYAVHLEAQARAQANGGVSQSDVHIDAQIGIDPTYADADLYDIAYS